MLAPEATLPKTVMDAGAKSPAETELYLCGKHRDCTIDAPQKGSQRVTYVAVAYCDAVSAMCLFCNIIFQQQAVKPINPAALPRLLVKHVCAPIGMSLYMSAANNIAVFDMYNTVACFSVSSTCVL